MRTSLSGLTDKPLVHRVFAAGVALILCSGPTLASQVAQIDKAAAPALAGSYTYKAIGGTGRTAKAIGGTGRTAKAIGGTGRTAKAIGGTGRTAKAIGGTGRTAKAIGGTGRTAKAIGGTGRTAKAIGGTGRTAKAIGGTGRTAKLEVLDLPLLRGRLDAWDPVTGVAQILGQEIRVESNSGLTTGMLVTVEGSVDGDGKLVGDYAWIDETEMYVDGASEVVISGIVTSVDHPSGTFSIGSLVVDYTAVLSINAFHPVIGSSVSARGIRPDPQGAFIATDAIIN